MNIIRDFYQIDFLHKKGITGKNIVTAVLDTGIYPHADFSGRILYFKDFVNHKRFPYDDNSHGSHVCGIIAGSGATSNGLYKGIAPDSYILPVKVLDSTGHGESDNIIEGLNWVLKNKDKFNISIVNISIGTESTSCSDEKSLLVRTVDKLWDNGLTVIVSAGNNGPSSYTITTPGISRKIITVGSATKMEYRDSKGKIKTTYSGKGPTHCDIQKPDIVAIGNHITSCGNHKDTYQSKSGTSMSTPIVSGAAALIYSYNRSITNIQFKKLLCMSAHDIGYDKNTQGAGMINFTDLFLLC